MIEKYKFGQPVIQTHAVVNDVALCQNPIDFGSVKSEWPFVLEYTMDKNDMVFGLGENVRGINKRGFKYVSWCSDKPCGNESDSSLYGAHNFIIVSGKKTVGLYFDTPAKITFDIGWTDYDTLSVSSDVDGVFVYVITSNESSKKNALRDIVRQFRFMIGQSYIPPLWAFGYQQSRWGYRTESDVREVVKKHKELGLPLDSVCLDIDYMEQFMDFTVDKAKFSDFAALNKELFEQGIHLVPIIDAGVKEKEGYSIYEEGVRGGHFCKKADGSIFKAGVWPGKSAFTDFFKKDSRAWFGSKYKALTDCGVEGFWNDMNEPALFYTDEGLQKVFDKFESFKGKNLDIDTFFEFTPISGSTNNQMDDYKSFYHQVKNLDGNEVSVSHDRLHNMYGALMTRAAREGLDSLKKNKRTLLYSRASCIGAHRDGGIWMGDNCSWWNNIELELRMLPSLNMCGFLYTGADIGGFGDSSSRDLVLRWLALGAFTPLMRNHSAWNTRNQECYAFGECSDFKSVLSLRYALLPYLYSEFVKASVLNDMMFRPLSFDYPEDSAACDIEDELLLGNEVLIAPVYRQNAKGRLVYLPEDMTQVTWKDCKAEQKPVSKGTHYIDVPEDTVVFFIKKGKSIPFCSKIAMSSSELDYDSLVKLGDDVPYLLYRDDGYTTDIDLKKNTIEF
ncbi:TIM-barrel domain-containing protein [uncultured Treponema sp.]|uniref:glycoside hydrolase family 31 protein n=1 Tax=uncultured Treponema sp. TaxID=162155 RepID=UPI0025CC5A03|nr:TIM-barrel domain-containing protein [uncultured Treponema sp.]